MNSPPINALHSWLGFVLLSIRCRFELQHSLRVACKLQASLFRLIEYRRVQVVAALLLSLLLFHLDAMLIRVSVLANAYWPRYLYMWRAGADPLQKTTYLTCSVPVIIG